MVRRKMRRWPAGTTGAAVALVALTGVIACEEGDADHQQGRQSGNGGVAEQALGDREIAALLELIDGTEIAAARALLPKLVSAPARGFAEMLIDDHARLRQARNELTSADDAPTPPPQFRTLRALTHAQSGMFAILPAGPAFDVTFLGVQAANHAMVVDSLRRWHGVAQNDGLRRAIALAIPVVDKHREQALAAFSAVRGAVPDTTRAAAGGHPHGAAAQHGAPDTAARAPRPAPPTRDTASAAP